MSEQNGLYLGIEGGGTRTVALLVDDSLQVKGRQEFGPGNLRLVDDAGLEALFQSIALFAPRPAAIGVGLAGLRDQADRQRVEAALARVWPGTGTVCANDLEIALAAAAPTSRVAADVLILSGTGSCCFGRNHKGETEKVGGWGHMLGDLASGYDIALRAIRSAVYQYDRRGRWGNLGTNLLRALALNSPDQLIAWAQAADKRVIAHVAPVVFAVAEAKDQLAREVLREAARQLASDALVCAGRLAKRWAAVRFLAAGSVLRKQPRFAAEIGRHIRAERPNASFAILETEGALGAARMALALGRNTAAAKPALGQSRYFPAFDPGKSPTEMRNPKSRNLDRLSVRDAVALMLDTEAEVVPALRRQHRALERAVQSAVTALRAGGRLFYAGAGTSGRLGVLDASECPPTFRASPEQVQGIIAGGQSAIWRAVEGAEDDWEAGAESVRGRGVKRGDLLVGIAASGRTPFVWGALREATRRGAETVLLTFNPSLQIAREHRPDIVIAPDLGPEILTGSTRLKCGTATKLILNMISTISMVRLGKVASNLMIDLNPSNVKLRDRATRILVELTQCDRESAAVALERQKWVVSAALKELQRKYRIPKGKRQR